MLENLLYDSKLDLCAFFVRPNERLVKMVFDNLKRHGVMPKGCPVYPGDSVVLTNVTLNYINLPAYLPETSFKLVVKLESTSNENRINVEIYTLQKIIQPRVIVILWLDVGSGALQAPFYNQTVDYCTFMKKPGTIRMVQVVYRELRRHGNVPTECPIPSGLYTFNGLSTNQMRFPSFFTQANFMMDLIGLTGVAKVRTVDTRWYGIINRVKCTAADRC
uniref:Uncharacterized protein n=1 Tax=Anopheles minimus TaxID=112268 RepID=A0A182W210_9DIPT